MAAFSARREQRDPRARGRAELMRGLGNQSARALVRLLWFGRRLSNGRRTRLAWGLVEGERVWLKEVFSGGLATDWLAKIRPSGYARSQCMSRDGGVAHTWVRGHARRQAGGHSTSGSRVGFRWRSKALECFGPCGDSNRARPQGDTELLQSICVNYACVD